MTTMADIVTGALKRLRVVNPRHAITAIDMSEGLAALNRMMHSWKAQGVDTDHETLEQTDDFPLDEEHEQGTIALLAVRIASDKGKEIDAGVARDAEQGWLGLQAEFVDSAPAASFDTGLTRVGRC
jgi:hypothetical protein